MIFFKGVMFKKISLEKGNISNVRKTIMISYLIEMLSNIFNQVIFFHMLNFLIH